MQQRDAKPHIERAFPPLWERLARVLYLWPTCPVCGNIYRRNRAYRQQARVYCSIECAEVRWTYLRGKSMVPEGKPLGRERSPCGEKF